MLIGDSARFDGVKAVAVMDPFHVVRLAGDAMDRCRGRVQQHIHGHRGSKGDPLVNAGRTLLTGADLLTDKQQQRLDDLFAPDDHAEIKAAWGIYQEIIAAYRLPLSALLTTGSASSSSSTAHFRTPLAIDPSRGGETLDQVRARRGTIALSHQIIDFALHGPAGSPSRRAERETLWSLVDGLFNAGDAMPTPSPAGNTSPDAPRQRQPS